MARPQMTKADRQLRRREILETAERLIAESGVENITMGSIAKAVGMTRRTIYAYYRNRSELLLTMLTDDLTRRWEFQQASLKNSDTGLRQLLVWAETLHRYSVEYPHTLELQIYWDFHGINKNEVGTARFKAFEKINNELAEGLRAIFKKGKRDGSMRPDLKTDLCISQFLASFRAVLNRAYCRGYSFASFTPKKYIKHFYDTIIRAYASGNGP